MFNSPPIRSIAGLGRLIAVNSFQNRGHNSAETGHSLVRPTAKRRQILFRITAVAIGLIPFLVLELVLQLCGWSPPGADHDPFVGFSQVLPLFELDESGEIYRISSTRLSHFCPDSFASKKPANEFRVFCIGDPTVQGNPWTTETSFTSWLELSLAAADPSRVWNVVNCGGISYASYRMVPILEEVLLYEPDLIVIHCSHNEFLEDRNYDVLKQTPRVVWRMLESATTFRSFHFLRWVCGSRAQSLRPSTSPTHDGGELRPVLAAEVQALLDYRGGLAAYHHDPEWRENVLIHYRYNLNHMVAMAKQNGISIIVMNLACNLRDCPPFKVEHRPGISADERDRIDTLRQEARSYYSSDPLQAVNLLRAAVEIDRQHAGLHYDLAKCLELMKDFESARAAYVDAKESDVCPLRALEAMHQTVAEIGRDSDTPIVDLLELFTRLSRNGIPGDGWFSDHVHPTIGGYQRVGDLLAEEFVRLGFVQPQPDWNERKEKMYADHLHALPDMYFLGGQRRLEALKLWTQGRVSKGWPGRSLPKESTSHPQ